MFKLHLSTLKMAYYIKVKTKITANMSNITNNGIYCILIITT